MKPIIAKEKDAKCFHIYNLILWNDNAHDMTEVLVALSEVCKLSDELCISVMMEAHVKGMAIAKNGEIDELLELKNGLNRYGLFATVELAVKI